MTGWTDSFDAPRVPASCRTISVDIFDTLLIRRTPPDLIPYLCARRLCKELERLGFSPGDVSRVLRLRREARLRISRSVMAEGEDPDAPLALFLPEWIRLAANTEDARFEALAREMLRFELDGEFRFTRPNRPLAEWIARQKHDGRRTIYASDMYLGRAGIDELLHRHGLDDLFERGYVSADRHAFKWSGKLFRKLLDEEGLAPRELLHLGDNPYSDGRVPKRMGIHVFSMPDLSRRSDRRRKERLFKEIADPAFPDPGGSLLELCHGMDSGNFTPEEAFGFEAVGPVFASFVHNVLERGRADGVGRLYFVSRDGYIFHRMFRELARHVEEWTALPEPVYLLMSRQAIFPAYRERIHEEDFRGWIRRGEGRETLRSGLRRYGHEDAYIGRIASEKHGLDPDRPLRVEDMERSEFAGLLADDELNAATQRIHADSKRGLRRYLRRAGLFGSERVGLVDIGWTGGTQTMLSQIFEDDPEFPALFGYYFALDRDAQGRETPKNRLYGILADRRELGFHSASVFSFLHGWESVSPAPHGTVTGYAPDGEPRIMAEDHPVRLAERQNDETVRAIQSGALRFARCFGELAFPLGVEARAVLPVARSLAARLSRAPEPEEARTLLGLQFSESFGLNRAQVIGGALPDENASLAERIRRLAQGEHRRAGWGRGAVELYRLPFVGFLYAAGGAYRLLPEEKSPGADSRMNPEISGSPKTEPPSEWRAHARDLEFLERLKSTVQRIENRAISDARRTLSMENRPPLLDAARRLELLASRTLVNALARLSGKPAYRHDGSRRPLADPRRVLRPWRRLIGRFARTEERDDDL